MSELLDAADPSPVEWIQPDRDSPIVIVCEHAGRRVPTALQNLGLSDAQLEAHIGWDIGAAAVARDLAVRLGAPAILQRYSRLVIDCNRPPDAPDSIPKVSDGVVIPGNENLSEQQRQQRIAEIFQPWDRALQSLFADRPRRAAFAVHSFTPMLSGSRRPWDVGFLFRHDTKTSTSLAKYLQAAAPELNVGLNEPYTIDDESDWFVPRYGETLDLQHSLVEIRNDLLHTASGQRWWSIQLANIIRQIL